MSFDGEGVKAKPREEMMKAVYKALRKHGYADLTMQKIADESNKCKSTFHYHYNTREELLVSFLEYLLTKFKEKIKIEGKNPTEQLNTLIDKMIYGNLDESAKDHMAFHRDLFELRSQAPYNQAFKEQLTKNEEFIRQEIAKIINKGIEKNEFKDVNSQKIAALIVASIDGARIRQITTNEINALKQVKNSLNQVINNILIK